jgi:hypothetical protein
MHIVKSETLEPHETVSMVVTPTPVHKYEYEQTRCAGAEATQQCPQK